MAAAEVRVIRVMNVDPPDKRGSVAVCSYESRESARICRVNDSMKCSRLDNTTIQPN
jgi:hypothetical protein